MTNIMIIAVQSSHNVNNKEGERELLKKKEGERERERVHKIMHYVRVRQRQMGCCLSWRGRKRVREMKSLLGQPRLPTTLHSLLFSGLQREKETFVSVCVRERSQIHSHFPVFLSLPFLFQLHQSVYCVCSLSQFTHFFVSILFS